MSWTAIISIIEPELILIGAACLLFLLGVSGKPAVRKAIPVIALLALAASLVVCLMGHGDSTGVRTESTGTFRLSDFGDYIKLLSSCVGILLILLAWPTDSDGTGNPALNVGSDVGEFFALALLSIAGIFLVAGANDIILLFLGIELASIPTYIMVSVSRPLPVAQEAGVKYFFLGAMAAALMLFGFSYLYGSTGAIKLDQISAIFAKGSSTEAPVIFTSWRTLAVVMLIVGFAFKMAAFPLHFYAGDVYEGAATPVTALLSYVPKTTGFVALIKILFAVGGGRWNLPIEFYKLLWIIAVLTMTFGNLLGLTQQSVKRMFAYSSIAHSGYMLVGVTTALSLHERGFNAIEGVLFYLAAYGIVNVAAFGVLIMLPSKRPGARAATSAETFEDLAGVGRDHIVLALAMAVACFSLVGLPLTVGFFGKLYLVRPALMEGAEFRMGNIWLVVIMMANAAISAGYYLGVVAVMFLRPASTISDVPADTSARRGGAPILAAIGISAIATLFLGTIAAATDMLHTSVISPSGIDTPPDPSPAAPVQLDAN